MTTLTEKISSPIRGSFPDYYKASLFHVWIRFKDGNTITRHDWKQFVRDHTDWRNPNLPIDHEHAFNRMQAMVYSDRHKFWSNHDVARIYCKLNNAIVWEMEQQQKIFKHDLYTVNVAGSKILNQISYNGEIKLRCFDDALQLAQYNRHFRSTTKLP